MRDSQENSRLGTWIAPHGGQVFFTYKYTINNTNLIINDITVETNQCAGLSDGESNQTLSFKVEIDKLSFTPHGETTFTIDRLQ
ncbi:hypothetical protein [Acinetobacter sp. NIPH 2699]|uniref:hypothetical protein n=1 Tax=Acinetobacter sp. NIPH 2699 TaxID=2923433 RepID=UPI001F4B5C26|nr:hypothetical protein [Acinetobacter sp. NIPH 2699]MCH7336938.1 hypothetical protein [Acinetobacter sp. NIPH 2699]